MLRYRHNDMTDLRRKLEQVPESCGCLIVTDGVFSMGGDIANLPEIVALAREFGARVMVDDAHGLGVIGKGGRGTASYFGLEDQVDVIMGTFSKSLASLGGFMAGKERVVDYVRHNSRPFIFSASIPPSNCAVALEALRQLKKRPELVERLAQLSAYARKGLTERGLSLRPSETPIIPIYTYDAIRTLAKAKELYDAGVYVNPVLPPATPDGECLLRTSYMASHTEAVLDEAHGLHCGSHRKGLPMKTGKVVLLTGGSSGIGQCTAQSLVKAGCRVYELSRRDSSQPGITHLACDVTREDQVQAAVKTVLDREGRIDVVVNNAGFGISGAVEFTKTEDASGYWM